MVESMKKEEIKSLLDRRAEIIKEVNKMQEEYTALGKIITYYLNNEKDRKEQEHESRIDEY